MERKFESRRPPQRPVDPVAAKAAEIARTTGLPAAIAKQVAAGKADLNEVLKRMAVADEVNRLMQVHDLNRALATQIVLGQAELAGVLARRRVEALLAATRDRSGLEEAAGRERDISLGVHGHKTLRGRVIRVDQYEFLFRDAETAAETLIHKLQVKYAFDPEDFKRVRKALDYDKARRERVVEPRARPQERYGCSDRRLGAALDGKTAVTAVTIEGECFSGEVSWVGRYEFGLRTKQGAEVILFRHALDDFQDGTAPKPKAG